MVFDRGDYDVDGLFLPHMREQMRPNPKGCIAAERAGLVCEITGEGDGARSQQIRP
jgi:hypothetical protein